jgi:hypothetical protein
MKIDEAHVVRIQYLSESKNETTTRTIIPTSVPKDIVRAIDVSDLSTEDQQKTELLVQDYKRYIADVTQMANF